MSQAQQQHAPLPAEERGQLPQTPAIEADLDPATGSLPGLTLEETLRVLDVARSLREQRMETELALNRDQVRGALRQKLIESARITGDTVSEAEIDAAVEQYFDTMYEYEEPKGSLKLVAAKAWVHRQLLLWGAAIAAAAGAAGWWYFG
jgi:hypothetical protein